MLLELAVRPSAGRPRQTIIDAVAWVLDNTPDIAMARKVEVSTESQRHRLSILPGEWWWGGAVNSGQSMPFGRAPHWRDLATSAGLVDDDTEGSNQSAPFLVSSAGRYVWSERPFAFAFDGDGTLEVDGQDVVLGQEGTTLASVFRAAASKHFPASGRTPAEQMFTAPQYNTWIEMPYHPTQQTVLDYARGVINAGLPPGSIMIDDRWSVDYGDWTFDRTHFPQPAEMTRQLHEMGFSIMLWLVPFLSPDSANSRMAARSGWLITGPDRRPVVREWWNGYSTILDLTVPEQAPAAPSACRSEGRRRCGRLQIRRRRSSLLPPRRRDRGRGRRRWSVRGMGPIGRRVRLQRDAGLLEDGRSAASAAIARQAGGLGLRRAWLADPRGHCPGLDRPSSSTART